MSEVHDVYELVSLCSWTALVNSLNKLYGELFHKPELIRFQIFGLSLEWFIAHCKVEQCVNRNAKAVRLSESTLRINFPNRSCTLFVCVCIAYRQIAELLIRLIALISSLDPATGIQTLLSAYLRLPSPDWFSNRLLVVDSLQTHWTVAVSFSLSVEREIVLWHSSHWSRSFRYTFVQYAIYMSKC